jgi:LruC domain-containing protein
LGSVPYNPYIIVDQQIGVEVHLPDMIPTSFANINYFDTNDDTSDPATGRYYKSATNLPWAINIVYDFVWPLESRQITQGYLKFGDWAESGGSQFPDWYKDLPDYRDNNYLDIQN